MDHVLFATSLHTQTYITKMPLKDLRYVQKRIFKIPIHLKYIFRQYPVQIDSAQVNLKSYPRLSD